MIFSKCKSIFAAVFILLLHSNCQFGFLPSPSLTLGEEIPYDMTAFDKEFKLSPDLDEISGLSFDNLSGKILAVNDEQGVIFSIDPADERITSLLLSGDADFEGVEIVEDNIYMLKSDGDLFLFDRDGSDRGKIENRLRLSNDVEGLGFDGEKQLLLACKGKAELKDKKEIKHAKAIYSFDIEKLELIEKPYLLITEELVEEFIDHNYQKGSPISKSDLEKRSSKFAPSGIAMQSSGDLYVLSDSGKMLIVLRNKRIVSLHFLDTGIHQKPEGICFNSDSDLLISNEGKGGMGRIYLYSLIK